jgi:hypothetical protein
MASVVHPLVHGRTDNNAVAPCSVETKYSATRSRRPAKTNQGRTADSENGGTATVSGSSATALLGASDMFLLGLLRPVITELAGGGV